MTHYEDTSPFRGVVQFETPDGEEFRVMHTGGRDVEIYRRDGDAFIRDGSLWLDAPVKSLTPKQLHSAILERDQEYVDES